MVRLLGSRPQQILGEFLRQALSAHLNLIEFSDRGRWGVSCAWTCQKARYGKLPAPCWSRLLHQRKGVRHLADQLVGCERRLAGIC